MEHDEQDAGTIMSTLKERRSIEHRSNKHAYVASPYINDVPVLSL